MLNSIRNYLNPNTASVLTKITTMIDALDNVNERNSTKAAKYMEASSVAKAHAMVAHVEATTAAAAAKKIASAFGVER